MLRLGRIPKFPRVGKDPQSNSVELEPLRGVAVTGMHTFLGRSIG